MAGEPARGGRPRAGSRARCRRCWRERARRASVPTSCSGSGARRASRRTSRPGLFLGQYLDVLDSLSAIDYPDLIVRAVAEAGRHRDELRARFRTSSSTSTRTPTRARWRCCASWPATAATSPSSVTRTSRSTRFRGADVRGILDFPATFRRPDGAKADVVVLRTTRRFGAHLLLASQRVAARGCR